MLAHRLGFSVSRLCTLNRPISVILQRNFSKKIDVDEDDKPIPFSTTPAATWKAEYHRVPPVRRVWYTPYVVSLSISVFMIYFCILREENDIDELIYRPLPETIQGIDKAFPDIDFYKKPEYVLFHERNKELKKTKKEMKEVSS